MAKPTDTQLVVLSCAAQRDDGAVLPLPAMLSLNKAAASMVLKSLIKRGLAEERPAGPRDEAWRETGDERMALFITETGLDVIGVEPDEGAARPKVKRISKKQTLLTLLRREGGATVADMIAATNWQEHSIRGFLSGTVRANLGLALTSNKAEGGARRYRITDSEQARA